MHEIRIRKTVMGCFNVTLVNHPTQPRVTLSPDRFVTLFPELSLKLRYGWEYVSSNMAMKIFGDSVVTYSEGKTA